MIKNIKESVKRTIKKISPVVFMVECIALIFISYNIGSIFSVMRLQTTDAEPNIARVDELEKYVTNVNLEMPEINGSLDGVNCSWRFLRGGSDVGKRVVVDNTTDHDIYTMEVRVKNETNHDISGLRLLCSLPTEPERSGIVCDTAIFCGWLEYGNNIIASTGLELSGGGKVPIDVSFVSGAAGYIRKNNAQAELLSAYDDDTDRSVCLADYWRNEGLELNVPAGEEQTIWVKFAMSPIYDLEATTIMTAAGTNQTGSKFSDITLQKDYQREFHVRTEIICHDDTPLPIRLWVHFLGKAELLPGTIKVDGESIDDLAVQSDEKDIDANFKPIQIKEGAKAGDTIVVEYDVKIWATDINAHTTYITNSITASYTSFTSTTVSADIKEISLW